MRRADDVRRTHRPDLDRGTVSRVDLLSGAQRWTPNTKEGDRPEAGLRSSGRTLRAGNGEGDREISPRGMRGGSMSGARQHLDKWHTVEMAATRSCAEDGADRCLAAQRPGDRWQGADKMVDQARPGETDIRLCPSSAVAIAWVKRD